MTTKNGNNPRNARVDVDYSSGKPKIKFSYPKTSRPMKKQVLAEHRFGYHTVILIILFYSIFIFINIYTYDVPNPTNCHAVLINRYYNSSPENVWAEAINITCESGNYYIKWDKKQNILGNEYAHFVDKRNSPYLIKFISIITTIWFLALIILNEIITRITVKSKRFNKWFPKAQANGLFIPRVKKYLKFTPEDVENNMVEIPYFKNVELDYKTEGDFSKYLQRIKVHEHSYYKYKKGKPSKKKEVKIYAWYARFYFKETPKTGFLEVIFQ